MLKFDNKRPTTQYLDSKFAFISSRDIEIGKRAIVINFGGNDAQSQDLYVWSGDSTTINKNYIGSRVLEKNLLTVRGTDFLYGDYTTTIPLNTNTIEKPMFLFAGKLPLTGDEPLPFDAYDMYVYDFKIYESDVLVKHFIPCYRNSDNKVGLYDIVNNVFYTNQGTGEFLYG